MLRAQRKRLRRRLPRRVRKFMHDYSLYWRMANRISRQRRANAQLQKTIDALQAEQNLDELKDKYRWAIRKMQRARAELWWEAKQHQATKERMSSL